MKRIKKNIILWMKTIHYPNKIRSQSYQWRRLLQDQVQSSDLLCTLDITIAPMAPFTPKSSSKFRSALHFRYSIVIPRFIPHANMAQS